jgi:hypothetical protein
MKMRIQFGKIGQVVRKSRLLRTLVLLCGLLFIVSIVLLAKGGSVRGEEAKIRTQIQANQVSFENLQRMAKEEEKKAFQQSLFEKKSFSSFEEVIPFIAYLEKLFSAIDPEARITIKSQEGQIFLDRFADYNVDLKMKPASREWLFKALDQLHGSRFIVKPMSFTMYYNPPEGGVEGENELGEVILVLRLYLK